MPRSKRNSYSIKEMYNWYRSLYKKYVDYKTYLLVIELYAKYMMEDLLLGKDIQLYAGFQVLGVRKKYKPYYIDYVQTKLQKKKVLMPNTHSDFYGAQIYWKHRGSKFYPREWAFRPHRTLSRALAQVMKVPGNHKRFVEMARQGNSGARIKNAKRYKL